VEHSSTAKPLRQTAPSFERHELEGMSLAELLYRVLIEAPEPEQVESSVLITRRI
jgi:hypothetical protein